MWRLKSKITRLLLILTLIIFFLPFINDQFHFIQEKPLNGSYEIYRDTVWTYSNWFNGSFSKIKENYINQNFVFRNSFVRFNNQMLFSLFGKTRVKNVVIGKNNYLFEEPYITTIYGKDFLGEDSIRRIVNKIKFIQDTLQNSGKLLLIVIAPNKARFYEKHIPDNLKKVFNANNNYEVFTKYFNNEKINYIDFNKVYTTYYIKDKEPFKYFTKYGIHWTYLSTVYVMDSIVHYISNYFQVKLPSILLDSISKTDYYFKYYQTEYDVLRALNLLSDEYTQDVYYPYFRILNKNLAKLNINVVSDSYFWNLYNSKFEYFFRTLRFWYYNVEVYPNFFIDKTTTDKIDLKNEVAKKDIFILMCTECNLSRIGFGLIDQLYNLYTHRYISPKNPYYDNEKKIKLKQLVEYIKTDKNWLNTIEKKAKERGISLDSMIVIDALWLIENEK